MKIKKFFHVPKSSYNRFTSGETILTASLLKGKEEGVVLKGYWEGGGGGNFGLSSCYFLAAAALAVAHAGAGAASLVEHKGMRACF